MNTLQQAFFDFSVMMLKETGDANFSKVINGTMDMKAYLDKYQIVKQEEIAEDFIVHDKLLFKRPAFTKAVEDLKPAVLQKKDGATILKDSNPFGKRMMDISKFTHSKLKTRAQLKNEEDI